MAVVQKIFILILIIGISSYVGEGINGDAFIDTHIHLLERRLLPYSAVANSIPDDNFSPSRFEADSYFTPVRYAVVVDASEDSEGELDYAIKESCCRQSLVGVVAGLSLRDPDFAEKIKRKYSSGRGKRMLVGIRNWKEHGEEFIKNQDLWPALRFMEERGLVLDLLARPSDLQRLTVIPETFPKLKIVINHMGMPYDEPQLESEWRDGMQNLAAYPNVFVKISGLMNADFLNILFMKGRGSNPRPTYAQFRPKMEYSIEVFGVDRIMYASNWPVDLIGLHNYTEIFQFIDGVVPLHPIDKEKLFRTNAIRIYGLNLDYPPCGGASSFQPGYLTMTCICLYSLVFWYWIRSE